MTRGDRRHESEVRAEAAVWLARIRSDSAMEADISNFRLWLDEDVRHRRAFDAVTAAWEAVGGSHSMRHIINADVHSAKYPIIRRRVLLATGVVAAAAMAAWRFGAHRMGTEVYSTEVGEQRRIALADGSFVLLDTNSRVAVAFDRHQRKIYHQAGRAFFEVAHDSLHPFVVETGDKQVVALGTAFDVSRRANSVDVVLVTGQVEIDSVKSLSKESKLQLRMPGDRVVFDGEKILHRDNVDLAIVTAWQKGRAVFDNETLADAIAEMNRYSRRPIVLESGVGAFRISGTYSVGDTEAFATSIAALLPVTLTFQADHIILELRVSDQAGKN